MKNSSPLKGGPQAFGLPDIRYLAPLPKAFPDSTNQVWEGVLPGDCGDLAVILKLCYPQDVAVCPFWKGMESLFGLKYPLDMEGYQGVYELMQRYSPLTIPAWLASCSGDESAPGVLLTQKVAGEALREEWVDKTVLVSLADHLGRLHRLRSERFGALHAPAYPGEQWSRKVEEAIQRLSAERELDMKEFAAGTVSVTAAWTPDTFVPIMPDLRWDQFLYEEGRLSALIDLDAMVWGDRRLEWVLLEYLMHSLDSGWVKAFVERYRRYADVPDLQHVRTPYRLLLFLMNVLGEPSLASWMKAPVLFDSVRS